jgi:hypothetical protein
VKKDAKSVGKFATLRRSTKRSTPNHITSSEETMTTLHHNNLGRLFRKPSSRLLAYIFYVAVVLAAVMAAVVQVSAQS